MALEMGAIGDTPRLVVLGVLVVCCGLETLVSYGLSYQKEMNPAPIVTSSYSLQNMVASGVLLIEIKAHCLPMKTYLAHLAEISRHHPPTKLLLQLTKIPVKPSFGHDQEALLPSVTTCAIYRQNITPSLRARCLRQASRSKTKITALDVFGDLALARGFVGLPEH